MAQRRAPLTAFYLYAQDQLPELRRRGLPVVRVVDALPYCSQAWASLTKEEKMTYREKARKKKERSQETVKETRDLAHPVPACLSTEMPSVDSFPDAPAMSWKNDEAVIANIFYFLDIYSHGELPPKCEQRFLPCEIGCVKYSMQHGIMADFHHFISPEVPPLGFQYQCQTASDATHKIPVSGFHLPRTHYAVVIQELLEFVQPTSGVRRHFYCRSTDRFRISWCLSRMASVTGIKSLPELLAVEDLVIELYQKKYQKELSKTWVCKELNVFMWDFCSNTRCKWHEENEIPFCALASCKKIAYCISKCLGSVYGVSLTAAHLPLQDSDYGKSTNTKMVIVDAGRFQKTKAEASQCDRPLASSSQDQELSLSNCYSPCGVKTSLYGTSTVRTMRGRGVTRLLRSESDLSRYFTS
ncbi:protein maelstrom homolog [Porphyrio hochstetteri]